MIPGELYYSSLKKLASLPEWKDYEDFLEERIKSNFEIFVTGTADLIDLQLRSSEIRSVKESVHQLIKEVEDSKLNRR